LIEALATLHPVEIHCLSPLAMQGAVMNWLRGRFEPGAGLPDPDLIVGAGHRTHVSMLAARRARGGRVVVLMKPSLPMRCFDLCVVPGHDRPGRRENVLVTQGALSRRYPACTKDPSSGLVLIGGPSRHFDWIDRQVVEQIVSLVGLDPDRRWILATSGRTPAGFIETLREELASPLLRGAAPPFAKAERGQRPARGFSIAGWHETDDDWLPAQLAITPVVWVTEDSVSMLYEALSAGAAVGLITLSRHGSNRITHGVDALIAAGQVTTCRDWRAGKSLPAPAANLDEALRCAREILKRWPGDR
jgi:mitochondrial fission protein ELM1